MYIESVEVGDFRNYQKARLDFHPHINILYGDNAQGKTNILESIFVCGTTNSHKGSKDHEMIRMGQEEAHIRMNLHKKELSHRIDMHLRKNKGKGIAIDGIPIKRSSELMGYLHVILFSPEDMRIIKNGPSERRRFINMELCQLDPIYLNDLAGYNKVLKQRNHLLKQIIYQPSLKDTLPVWDEKLIEYGKPIISRRRLFIEKMNQLVFRISGQLTGKKENICISYDPDAEEESFEQRLQGSLEKDMKLCSTSVGPHRDDLLFTNQGMDLRKYGSQGQQRTCALALKLAEIEIVKQITGDFPVLLLDDVLSELDRSRQNYLLDSIHDIQTIITCTGLEEFIDSRLTLDKIFRVAAGTVTIEK